MTLGTLGTIHPKQLHSALVPASSPLLSSLHPPSSPLLTSLHPLPLLSPWPLLPTLLS